MQKLIISIIIFLIMYRPNIYFFKSNLYIPAIAVLLLLVLLRRGNLKVRLNSIPVRATVSVFLIIFYLYVVVEINSADYEVFKSLVSLFFSFLCSIFLYATYKEYFDKNLPEIIFSVGFFQSAICIAMILIPSFREFYSVIGTSSDDWVNQFELSRNYGIAGGTEYVFGIGLVHGLLALVYIDTHIEEFAIIDFLKILILLMPALLDARTGLLCFVVSVVSYMIFKPKKQVNIDRFLRFLGIGLVVSTLGIVAFSLFKKYFSEYYDWLLMMVDAINALVSGDTQVKVYEWYGGLSPQNWVLPEGIQFWFGSGKIPTDITYMYSGVDDSGYYRIIWYGGIVLLTLAIACMFLALKVYTKEKNKQILALDFSIFLFILVANAKGNAMVQSAFMSTVLLIVINNKARGKTIKNLVVEK